MNNLFLRIYFKLSKYILNFHKKSWLKKAVYEGLSIGDNCNISLPIITMDLKNIKIGDNFSSGERFKLRTFNNWGGVKLNPSIIIGDNVNIETDCHISAINSVIIEDNVLIASFVYISDHSHGKITGEELDIPPLKRELFSKGPVKICKNTWLGEKVTVLPGVTIGEGCIIGANSVVTKDIPPFSVAAGIPAKVIRTLK